MLLLRIFATSKTSGRIYKEIKIKIWLINQVYREIEFQWFSYFKYRNSDSWCLFTLNSGWTTKIDDVVWVIFAFVWWHNIWFGHPDVVELMHRIAKRRISVLLEMIDHNKNHILSWVNMHLENSGNKSRIINFSLYDDANLICNITGNSFHLGSSLEVRQSWYSLCTGRRIFDWRFRQHESSAGNRPFSRSILLQFTIKAKFFKSVMPKIWF